MIPEERQNMAGKSATLGHCSSAPQTRCHSPKHCCSTKNSYDFQRENIYPAPPCKSGIFISDHCDRGCVSHRLPLSASNRLPVDTTGRNLYCQFKSRSHSIPSSPCSSSFSSSSSSAFSSSHHSPSITEAMTREFLGQWPLSSSSKDAEATPSSRKREHRDSRNLKGLNRAPQGQRAMMGAFPSNVYPLEPVPQAQTRASNHTHVPQRCRKSARRDGNTCLLHVCKSRSQNMGTLHTGSVFIPPQRVRTQSVDSNSSDGSTASPCPSSYYRVLVLGEEGVGKSSLVRELAGGSHSDTLNDDIEDQSREVVLSVELDDEESTMEFVDSALSTDIEALRPDAFLVVYSVSDRKSFDTAVEILSYLRCDLGTDRTVNLVANKMDLRRQQRVTAKEGQTLAIAYDCHFVETSAALLLNIDALLVGILTQIRRQLSLPGEITSTNVLHSKSRASSPARAFHFFRNLIRHARRKRSIRCYNMEL